MDYRRVLAIDVGYKNFAWCILDSFHRQVPIHHQRECLWRLNRKPTVEDIVPMTKTWCDSHARDIAMCDYIVLERQMRPLFIAMNVVLHTLFTDKVIIVHPQTVGTWWRLPRTRNEKKADGIKKVLENGVQLPKGKADDLADAWLMAAYQMCECGAWSKRELKI